MMKINKISDYLGMDGYVRITDQVWAYGRIRNMDSASFSDSGYVLTLKCELADPQRILDVNFSDVKDFSTAIPVGVIILGDK